MGQNKVKEFLDNNPKKVLAVILILIILFVLLFLLSKRYLDDTPITPKPTPNEISDIRDITSLSPVSLTSGKFTVGKDIKSGRYAATTGAHLVGVLTVYELDSNLPEISSSLGIFSETSRVESIALSLKEGQVIEIEKMHFVLFTPLETKLRTELTTGFWTAGLDIEAGTYKITSKDGLYGNIKIFASDDKAVAAEKLGKSNETEADNSVILTIREGEKIRIFNTPSVLFEKVDTKN